MTDIDIESLARLEKKATPGPWNNDPHSHPSRGCRCMSCYQAATVWQPGGRFCDDVPYREDDIEDDGDRCEQFGYSFNDAELIAAMRNALPELIEAYRAVERVRALATAWSNSRYDELRDAAESLLIHLKGDTE